MTVTVVIVDDHAAFRSSARRMLEAEGFEIVGEAEDGASAVETVRAAAPDVVLLDIALPDASGYDVAEQLDDGPSVVLTSSRSQSDLGRRRLHASRAVGFIPKDRLSGEAITSLLRGVP